MTLNSSDQIDIISCREARTIPELFRQRVARSPEAIAYAEFDNNRQQWRDWTWAQMAQRVEQFQAALDQASLDPGDRVAILLPNGTNWVAFDIAAMGNGLIAVPLYGHDSASNIANIITDSGARLALCDTQERWDTLKLPTRELTHLEHVWVLDGENLPLSLVDGKRQAISIGQVNQSPLQATGDPSFDPDDVATLIYTSGTTGRPKGVMLSHAAILWNAEAASKFIPPLTSDVFLSVLPLAHAFERTLGYYLPMMAGSTVAYARSVQTLREDLAAIKPTVLLAVPRLYERVHLAILREAQGNLVKAAIVKWTAEIGWKRHESQHDRGPPPGLIARLLWPLLECAVARRAMAAFGGRLRVAISGGAALPIDSTHFLIGMGLPLVEGYGLTEAGPVVTASTLNDSLPGSVGRPLHGLELKIGKENELHVRSPSVMLGYWGDPKQSSQTLDNSGWLKTGDVARLEKGHVYIDGRLKEIIALSTGEKVNPNHVEAAILQDPLFQQVCIVGDGRPCLIAIAVLNQKHWQSLATGRNLDPQNPNADEAIQVLLERLNGLLRVMPRHGIARALHIAPEPWTIEGGFLTPTLKIKRNVVEQRYGDEIAALYLNLSRSARQASQSTR